MAELPKRKRLRLPEYDYSRNGVYFVTVCTKGRRCLFWEDVGADIIRPGRLSPLGRVVEQSILDISAHYPRIVLEKWVIMPNHIHLLLRTEYGGRMISAPTRSVSTVVGQMKRTVSRAAGYAVWQKSFYDHIIRDENDFLRVWNYIDANPAQWAEDCDYEESAL